jgi:hypothetical protein
MKIYIILIAIITLCSCSQQDTKQLTSVSDTNLVYTSMNERSRSGEELEAAVRDSGDIEAYEDLSIALLEYPLEEGEIKREIYAKIMANKYNYTKAYVDVFQCMATCNGSTLDCLSKIKKDSAIYYLKTAIKKDDTLARELAKEYNINF